MNMNEGPMDGAKGGGIEGVGLRGWEVGVGRAGESGSGKMETTVFKHQ